MRKTVFTCTPLFTLTLLLASYGTTNGAEPEYPVVKPGPEHEILKKMEGTWNATIKMSVPGQPSSESKGTMVCKMECGGLWLTSSFTGEFGGMQFTGRGLDTYDSTKKKYVMVWVDSMSTSPMTGEGSYAKDKKTLTMVADHPGPDGKMVKHKLVSVHKDDDTIDWSMGVLDKDGKETVMMTIAYKRKK